MKLILIGCMVLLLVGCGLTEKQCKDIALKEADAWKELGKLQGMNRAMDICEENSNQPHDRWTEEDRYCFYVLNGETEYMTAQIICKGNSKYEDMKKLYDEKSTWNESEAK